MRMEPPLPHILPHYRPSSSSALHGVLMFWLLDQLREHQCLISLGSTEPEEGAGTSLHTLGVSKVQPSHTGRQGRSSCACESSHVHACGSCFLTSSVLTPSCGQQRVPLRFRSDKLDSATITAKHVHICKTQQIRRSANRARTNQLPPCLQPASQSAAAPARLLCACADVKVQNLCVPLSHTGLHNTQTASALHPAPQGKDPIHPNVSNCRTEPGGSVKGPHVAPVQLILKTLGPLWPD